MGYIALSTMAKTAIATTIAGGILITGITWQGGQGVTNIKGNINNIKADLNEAIADNSFLKTQFTKLKGLYASSVEEANGKIDSLVQDRDDLTSQVADLKAQLTDASDNSAEKTELQNEVNRLEGELDKANKAVAELETYAANADAEADYTAMNTADKTAYTATEVEVEEIPLPISAAAMSLDSVKAELMGSVEKVAFVEDALQSTLPPAAITGITTYTTTSGVKVLAYEIEESFAIGSTSLTESMKTYIGTDLGYLDLYFVTSDGSFVAAASKWGSFSIIKQ